MKSTIKKEVIYEVAFEKDFITSFSFQDEVARLVVRKYGAIDNKGNILIEPKYDYLKSFVEGKAIYSIKGKYGYIDIKGQQLTDPIFDEALSFHNNLAIVKINNNYGVIDERGEFIIKPQYEKLEYFHQQKLIFKKDDKYGLMSSREEIIKEPIFEQISYFSEGPSAFKDKGKWGYMDDNGEIIIPAKFGFVHSFHNDRAAIEFEKKWGIIDLNGDFIIDPQFDSFARSYSDGLACIGVNKKYGFVDSEGKVVIEPKYDSFARFSDGIAHVYLDGKGMLIDTEDNIINIPEFDFIGNFNEGLACVEVNGKYGFIDKKGQIAIPLNYDNAYYFNDGIAPVNENGKWFFINNKGIKVFDIEYDYIPFRRGKYSGSYTIVIKRIFEFVNPKGQTLFLLDCESCSDVHDGVVWFKRNGKYGFLNKNGDVIIEPSLDEVNAESNYYKYEGWLIIIKKQNKEGIVYKGKMVLPPSYERVVFSGKIFIAKEEGQYKMFDLEGHFIKDLPFEHVGGFGIYKNAEFRQNGKYGIIDEFGNIIIEAQYDLLAPFSDGLACFKKNRKWGYINKRNEVVIEPQFESCLFFNDGYAKFEKDRKYGLIDTTGKIIIPPKYEACAYDSEGLFRCRLEDTIFFYDDKLNLVNQIALENYQSGFNNLIKIKQADKFGLIKSNGEIVLEPKYDEITDYSEFSILKQNGRYGIINKEGKIVTNPIFESIYYDRTPGISVFGLGKKYGLIDKMGNILVDPIFDMLGSFSEGFAGFVKYTDCGILQGYVKVYKNLEDYISYKLEDIETEYEYVLPRVDTEISQWSKKGEFEKTIIWEERIANKKEEKIAELTTKYQEEYKAKEKEHDELKKSLRTKYFELRELQIRKHFSPEKLQISKYDADNETFLIIVDEGFGKIVLSVPLEIAPEFKENWETVRETADLEFIVTEDIELKTLTFYYGDKKIVYDSSIVSEYNLIDSN